MNFINIVLVDRTTHSRICPIVKGSSIIAATYLRTCETFQDVPTIRNDVLIDLKS